MEEESDNELDESQESAMKTELLTPQEVALMQ
jgi:hypothetical protein